MKFCRKTIWLMVAAAALLPAGCASQRGRMASKHEINTAQLLAAARQYEKEGHLENAAHIYGHVLKYHPMNEEARESLALVQQGKLRVDYDPQQLLASTNPEIQSNPQARKQIAKQQVAQREQVNERMAQLISSAAKDPKTINVDATPTPAMVASVTASSQPQPAVSQPKSASEPKSLAAVDAQPMPTVAGTPAATETEVAQVGATSPHAPELGIESAGFSKSETSAMDAALSEQPESTELASSDDSQWSAHSLINKCHDANAAVLSEVTKLEDDADDVRKDGLTRLAQMGPEAKSAAPAIRRLLADQNQLVVAHAAWALWETDGDSTTAVDVLKGLLSSKSTDVVQFSAYTLGHIGEAANTAAPELLKQLNHADSITRLHAAEALTLTANADQRAEATDTLLMLLKDESADVRSLAAMTLGQVVDADAEAAIAALTSALDDDDSRVRAAAALSLGAFGISAQPAVTKLEKTAKSDQTEVREAAEMALACIKL